MMPKCATYKCETELREGKAIYGFPSKGTTLQGMLMKDSYQNDIYAGA